MRFVFAVLCVLCVAAPAASMHIVRGSLQHAQQSTAPNDSENRGNLLRVNSGRLDDYGLDSSDGGIYATDEVPEPLLVKTEFVYNGGKKSRRHVSSSDESVSRDGLFQEESKEAELEMTTFSFAKRRLEGDATTAAEDEPSAVNIGGTTGEEPQGANSIPNGDHDDVVHQLDIRSPKQDVDSAADGNLVRLRRGIVFVPAMKTIPEVLDMGRARCRHPQRLERGRVLCRPVW